MKFYELLKEATKKKEINQVLKDEQFRIGVEFEFIFNSVDYDYDEEFNIGYFKHYGFIQLRQLYDKYMHYVLENKFGNSLDWDIGFDGSVKPNNKEEKALGVEVATPIMTLEEALLVIPSFFNIITECGYTNDTCGLHINVSHEKYPIDKINKKALALSLEDPRIYKYMPSRKDNYYAQSTELHFRSENEINKEKNQTLNIQNDRIEFRGMGGKDYEFKWDIIKPIILNYLVKFKKSITDPYFMKRELLRNEFRMKELPNKNIFLENIRQGNINEIIKLLNIKWKISNDYFGPGIEILSQGLITASYYNHLNIVKILLNSGADMSYNNYNCFLMSAMAGNFEIFKFLYNNDSLGYKINLNLLSLHLNISKLFLHAIDSKNVDFVDFLIEQGIKNNKNFKVSNEMFDAIIVNNDYKMMETLLTNNILPPDKNIINVISNRNMFNLLNSYI